MNTLMSTIARLAWPSLGLAIIQSAVSLTEIALAVRIGVQDAVAVSIIYPVFLLIQTVSNGGFGSAVASQVARAMGARDRSLAGEFAVWGMILALSIGVAIAVAYVALSKPILTALLDSPEAVAKAHLFGAWILGGAFVYWLSNCAVSVARGMGIVRPALYVSAVVYGLQLLILATAIIGFGASSIVLLAVASLGAALLIGVVMWIIALNKLGTGAFGRAFAFRNLRELASKGAYSSATSAVNGASFVMISAAAAKLGAETLAAYGIVVRIETSMMLMASAIGVATVATCAGAMGAGKTEPPRLSRRPVGLSQTATSVV